MQDRRVERAAEMIPALAPIETGAAKRSTPFAERVHVDSEVEKKPLPLLRDMERLVVSGEERARAQVIEHSQARGLARWLLAVESVMPVSRANSLAVSARPRIKR